MRLGFNPHKNKIQTESGYFHQVVIPVYIPNEEDYFKDSFEILKLCLASLFKTSHNQTYITIVNNGSCEFIVDYLDHLYKENKIQELIHVSNIGYINAMLKGITGQNFPLITTSDADVIFLNGWQEATYSIFENFDKAGAVCPTPSSRSFKTHTSNIYWDNWFNGKIKFTDVVNPAALKAFGHSVGNPDFYNAIQLKKHLTLSGKNSKAVVGAGHFIVTYRAAIFNNLEKRYTEYILGGNSDDLFDLPVVKKGFWRLSTTDNFTYHMGNVLEDWMFEEVSQLEQKNNESSFQLKSVKLSSKWSYYLKSKLFAKLLFNKKVLKYYFIMKGLSKDEAKNYLKG